MDNADYAVKVYKSVRCMHYTFVLHDAMLVPLSVRLSVACRYCLKTAKRYADL